MVRLSSTEKSTPCVCAPSRSVVSNRMTRSLVIRPYPPWPGLTRPPSALVSASARELLARLRACWMAGSLAGHGEEGRGRRSSLHLPSRTHGAVFQHDAFGQEFVAKAIRFLEVLRLTCGVTGRDEP